MLESHIYAPANRPSRPPLAGRLLEVPLAVGLLLVAMTRDDAAVGVRIDEVVGELTAPKAMRLRLGLLCARAAVGALRLVSALGVTSVSLHGRVLLHM